MPEVKLLKLFPSVTPDIVEAASLLTAIAAVALISPSTIVPSRIIVLVTVPVSPVLITVPVVAGNVIVFVPAVAVACNVIVPLVLPGNATLVIPVSA